jgi:hypothetical protein
MAKRISPAIMDESMRYKKAPQGWSYGDSNPFTSDGSYLGWSSFCILDTNDDQIMTGQVGSGSFSARFGRQVKYLEARLIDFLRYENEQGRTVILSFPEDMDVDHYIKQAESLISNPNVVRPDDPKTIVHSTTLEAWNEICADGQLKSAAELSQSDVQSGHVLASSSELEQYLKNEPPEYSNYIMFGEVASTGPEMIIASYQAGRFVLDNNAVYEPGVRLYFDNHRMIQDSLVVRDGLHTTKVHKHLPLSPYLLAAIGVKDVDPYYEVKTWTLQSFVERANQLFFS